MRKAKLVRAAGCALSVALACSPVVLWSAPAYAESNEVEAYSLDSVEPEARPLEEGKWDTDHWNVNYDGGVWNIDLPESGNLYISVKVEGKQLWDDFICGLHNADGEEGFVPGASILTYPDDKVGTVVTFGPFDVSAGKYPFEVAGGFYDIDSNAVSVMYYLDVEGKYSDVNSAVEHSDDIAWLAKSGVSNGWQVNGVREFRPYAEIARADMAAFLYRLAGSPEYTASETSPFKDVDAKTPHYKEICWLAEEGISEGWSVSGGKEFRPYAKVTRCDMAAFLYRLAGEPDYTASDDPFADCNAKTPHYNEVCWLASTEVSAGWTEKDGTKTFRSYNKVARADMAAFLHRMKDKDLV